jgi:hypothetical protein
MTTSIARSSPGGGRVAAFANRDGRRELLVGIGFLVLTVRLLGEPTARRVARGYGPAAWTSGSAR